MRIDEITINIPITIDLDGDKPRVNVAGKEATDDTELDQNPVMVPPQQQELELKKAEQGKNSPIIDKILDDDDQGEEEDESQVADIRALAGLSK